MSARNPKPQAWEEELRRRLPLLGHRNWIVVADAAYPAQCAPGVTTIPTGRELPDVLRAVLAAVSESTHVRAKMFADREIEFVGERDAPGIGALRRKLRKLAGSQSATEMPHEEILERINGAAAKYEVLVLKTATTLPYTSVFLELDCGYWNESAEARLRAAISR